MTLRPLARPRAVAVVALAAATLGILAATANALLAQTPLRATDAIERLPRSAKDSTGTEYLAWTQGPRGHPFRVHAYLQRGSERRIRLDHGIRGYTGGIDLPRVAYSEVVNAMSTFRYETSNIYVYDVNTGIRSELPGVNTAKWEYLPSISGDWVLFGRDDNINGRQRVVARNISSGAESLLSSVPNRLKTDMRPGQVNGTWATWWRCVGTACAVFKRNLAAGGTTRLPIDRRHALYASAITTDGTVYAARSAAGVCGGVTLRRFGPADPAGGRVLVKLPPHVDTSTLFARENGDGSVELVYERVRCGTSRFNVYSLHDSGA
jgi:hypothetical protein